MRICEVTARRKMRMMRKGKMKKNGNARGRESCRH